MTLPTPYYHDEASGITIYHGDCREILPTIEADVMVTDPPYGLDFPYASYDDTRSNLAQLIHDVMPLIPRRAFVLCGPSQIQMYPSAEWVSCITWNTTGSFGKFGYSQWTPVLCYGDDLKGFGNVNGVTKSDTIRINGGSGVGFQRTKTETLHTCPKPLNVMRMIIGRYTESNELIVDPFMGSGTTLVAAKGLNRQAIGIEIEEKYCEIAAKRLQQSVLALGIPA